ncbi:MULTISPECIES: hypothetical protein [Aerosakkonema]|uniref:hypothetical protein n=1 Tax=Aerosakkonema TaxID=1246629 RepID=UPI0035B8FFE4
MPIDLIIWIAAIVVAGLVFTLLLKVVKATIKTAITIAIIVLILQLFFGIGPNQLWQQIIYIPQAFWQAVTGK